MKNKKIDIEFGFRLRNLRESLPKRDNRFVFQYEVAKESGISVTSVQQAEKGIVPGKAVLFLLAKYFNMTVDYLEFGRDDHVAEEMPLYQGNKSELQDGEFPWGKTHQHDVEGAPPLTVTEFEPKEGQVKGPLRAAMEGLGEIFDSGDQVLTQAIQANIRAFQLSARRERQNTQQAQNIKALENKCDEFKDELDSMKETVNTLKKRLEDNPPHIHEEAPTKQKAI